MTEYFKDEAELNDLVRAFETCTIHPAEFKHYQHLAVALWYVANFPFAEAADRMRSGIQTLAAAYGKMGYHETITMFWLEMVRRFVAEARSEPSNQQFANEHFNLHARSSLRSFDREIRFRNSLQRVSQLCAVDPSQHRKVIGLFPLRHANFAENFPWLGAAIE